MIDAFGRVVEIIITVILLFLVPVSYMASKQDSITQTYVTTECAYLVDSVRNTGFLSRQMYESFLKKLDQTGQAYEIELNHYKRIVDITEEEYLQYYHGIYKEDILTELSGSEKERYELNKGDFFSIRVANKNKTLAARLQGMFYGRLFGEKQIQVVYGGAVRDEVG